MASSALIQPPVTVDTIGFTGGLSLADLITNSKTGIMLSIIDEWKAWLVANWRPGIPFSERISENCSINSVGPATTHHLLLLIAAIDKPSIKIS